MGHPIDPGDPTNGGCSLCIGYLPEWLDATYIVNEGDTYSGFIHQQILTPNVWTGFITNAEGDPKSCGIQLCVGGTYTGGVSFTGRQPSIVPDAHCNMPFTGMNPQGDKFRFTLGQPPP